MRDPGRFPEAAIDVGRRDPIVSSTARAEASAQHPVSSPPDLSVILPIHNERANLEPVLLELAEALRGERHEIIAVDDGSTDGSAKELHRLGSRLPELRIVRLEHRAGQSAGVMAGFDAARGEIVVTMDADGQYDPADVGRLLEAARAGGPGTDVVGYRVRRADGMWKRVQSRIANTARNWITGDVVHDTGCSLRVMHRTALLRIPRFDGMHRFLPTLLRLEGQRVLEIEVAHRRRRHGRTKYGMWNRVFGALRDAFGVRWLRRRPLQVLATEESADDPEA